MNREEAIEIVRKNYPHVGFSDSEFETALRELIPELRESEDERIRKLLVWQVYRNIEDETNDLAQSVYDGIKGHDPDIEESIEDWKKCLAYLEKQKEQKTAEKQDYTDLNDLERAIHRGFLAAGVENVPVTIIKETAKECLAQMKPAGWSEEDSRILYNVIAYVGYAAGQRGVRDDEFKEANSWLKSLRPQPHWKPSEEQMKVMKEVVFYFGDSWVSHKQEVLESLYNDLKKL